LGVKEILPAHFEVITPGIRPSGSDIGDQVRIATPKEAIQNGATLLVVGRPITEAKEPDKAGRTDYKRNLSDIVGGILYLSDLRWLHNSSSFLFSDNKQGRILNIVENR